jgi:hypothetical protein
MSNATYSDSWTPIVLAGGTQSGSGNNHPITLSILTQLSQDIHQSTVISGTDEDQNNYRDNWAVFVVEAIYQSLLHQSAYLILDFGDDQWKSDPADWNPSDVTPFMITHQLPTLSLVETGRGIGTELVHESRYLKFVSPYRFKLASVLDQELIKHDVITRGLEQTIAGQGVIKTGIDNLYEIMRKGGQALSSLKSRLIDLKGSTRQDGIIAYDKSRESVDIQLKSINREPEVLRVIENRITAITGLPSFLIWGHTDGDGYGVKTSLDLYDQRLSSLGTAYAKLIQLIIDITDPGTSPDYRPKVQNQSIYKETKNEIADRFDKLVSSLMGLQSIGAMTAIEVRNTVDADPAIRLVLDPNPQIIATPPNPNPGTSDPGSQLGFSG